MHEPASRPGAAPPSALAGELRVAVGRLIRRLREEAPPGGLTWSQLAVIGRLDREGPATITTLARAEGVRPQSIGATVADLEAAGLVRGAADPADGRRTVLSLTAACRKLIKAKRAAREDWLSRAIQAKLSVPEQARLARAVDLFNRLAD